jgi:endonuclease YncB( thermonuclease family)
LRRARNTPRILSRNQRTALKGLALLGAVLLVWLDHQHLLPQRPIRATSADRTATSDWAAYNGQSATVLHVVDGDTLHIDLPDRDENRTKVRLLGIDAPELASSRGPAMYYAHEAADSLKRMADGERVRVYLDERAGSRDKYGRLLAYIELPDGRFANEVLISEGCVYADRRFAHGYSQKYLHLEDTARSQKAGLWAHVTEDQLPEWLQERAPTLLRRR